jgi:hypothetical protein
LESCGALKNPAQQTGINWGLRSTAAVLHFAHKAASGRGGENAKPLKETRMKITRKEVDHRIPVLAADRRPKRCPLAGQRSTISIGPSGIESGATDSFLRSQSCRSRNRNSQTTGHLPAAQISAGPVAALLSVPRKGARLGRNRFFRISSRITLRSLQR